MGNSLRHLVLLLVAAALTLAPGAVFAGALPVPVNISPVSASPSGLQSVVTFDARGVGGAANAGYYSRPVLISNNTLGGLANGLARRAVPVAAFTAAVAAGGWVIDELTKQVQTPGSPQEIIPSGSLALYWGVTQGYYATSSTLHPAVLSYHNETRPQYPATHIEAYQDGGFWRMKARPWDSSYVASFVSINQPTPDAGTGVDPVPLTVPELADLIKNNPQLWNDSLRNPDGSVNRNPDVQAAAEELAQQLNDPNASPQPDPTAEWDTGQQGGDPQNSPTALEFPNFCEWASVVCSFIDWVKGTDDLGPDAELPVTEIPVTPSTWTSGLGGGACPANKSLSLSVWSGSVSFQPVCDLAAYIRPLVILSALLIGAFIISGANKQNV
jgi:hypothetical protein